MQFHEIIPDTVKEHPESASPSYKKALPPPMVVLVAEGDINRDDGHLRNGEDQDDRNNREKTKDVIITGFVLPQRLEDKEQLDEDHCEGDETS